MSNYANTKATIAANVYENHLNQVTANMAKAAINSVVDSLITGGFLYKGVATTSTNPGTPDPNIFYIATAPGTYTNFGSLVVNDGEVAILKYNGSWSKEVTGAATAAEVSALGREVDDLDVVVNGQEEEEISILSQFEFEDGKYYPKTSTTPATNVSSRYSTNRVDVSSYKKVVVFADDYESISSDVRACLLIDEDDNILSALTWAESAEGPVDKELEFDVEGTIGAKYLLVSYAPMNCPNGIDIIATTPAVVGFDSRISALELEISGTPGDRTDLVASLVFANSYYYKSDSVTPVSNAASKYSTMRVDISGFDKVDIYCNDYSSTGSDTRACLIIDESDNILAASTWAPSATPLGKREIIFNISTIPGAKYLLASYSTVNCPNGIKVDGVIEGVAGLEQRVSALENGDDKGYMHISFDDVNAPFAWLASNYAATSSIFEENFLNLLKDLHDTYGCVFTLNCFLTNGLDLLAAQGGKFAAEFSANADWLKFAFHAYAGGVSYAADTAQTYRASAEADYAAFVAAVKTITGGVKNIHQVTRLGYFEGDEDKILEFKNQPMGAYGFLCADDSRDSYYLDTAECNLIRWRGHWFDAKNSVYFVATNAPRFDVSAAITQPAAATLVAGRLSGLDFAEVFMHQATIYSDPSNDTLYTDRGNIILDELCKQGSEKFHPDFTQFHLLNY